MKNILLILLFIGQFLYSQDPGSSYYGPYTSHPPMVLNGINDSIISGLAITGNTYGIRLSNCTNITIENCYIYDTFENAVNIENSSNITIRNNVMEDVRSGVYAAACTGGIKILNNDVKNVQGPFPRGQLAQFNNSSGTGNQINDNVMENVLGESYAEDGINLYGSSGTVASPIEVIGNWIRGGGPSNSGGGIMTGDSGGSHIVVRDNILVDPGQYGIAIAGGEGIEIYDNLVYGKQQSFTNVGIYVWNQYAVPCSNHSVGNNTVYWRSNNGNLNPAWNAGNCGTVTDWGTNTWNAAIDSTILSPVILKDTTGLLKRFYVGESRVYKTIFNGKEDFAKKILNN